MHGTFVAGILFAKRGSRAPAICPNCEIILCPIFKDVESEKNANIGFPSSTPDELSSAIIETVDAGARLINLSLGLSLSSLIVYDKLLGAYSYARRHGTIVVVAA